MSREEFIEVFDVLAEEGAIVEDGTWTERYIDRILNTEKAAVAAVEAIDDDEAMAPHLDPLTGIQVRSGLGAATSFRLTCMPRSHGFFNGILAFYRASRGN